MKYIRPILFALTLITIIYECKCEEEVDRFRLIQRIEKLKEESFPGSDEQPDEQCVKDFLNFPQNDKMIVNEMESLVLMIATTLKCLGRSKLLNFYFDMLLPDDKESKLNCMRYNLKKVEPESKLLENFEISDEDAKNCEKDFPLDELEEIFNKIEHITGPAMEFSCGSFAGYVDVLKLLGRIAGIKLGNFSEEVKETEMGKLKKYFEDVVLTTAECILKRFEKNPEAFNINDTLNYYYTESLKPFTPNIDADHTTNYNDNLNNLETNFDQECIKEKLNLPENGQKVLLKIEALTIIASAKSKCIKDDKLKFYDDYLKFAVEDDQKTDEKIACANYELQKIEPTSKLVQLPNNDKDYEKICNSTYIGIFPYNDYFYNMYRFTGKLEDTTCGVYNHQDRDELYFKTLLLAVEKDEILKKSEAEDFFIFVTSKLQKLADCFLGRI